MLGLRADSQRCCIGDRNRGGSAELTAADALASQYPDSVRPRLIQISLMLRDKKQAGAASHGNQEQRSAPQLGKAVPQAEKAAAGRVTSGRPVAGGSPGHKSEARRTGDSGHTPLA